MASNAVLIIGGGIAGLCAAIAARRLGVDAHVLESAPRVLRGGNARHARNFRIAHEKPVWHTPDAYSDAEFLAELRKTGCPDEVFARGLVEESARIADWLMGCGVLLQAPDVGVLPYSRRTAFLLGGGKAMVNALYDTASRLGVSFDYESEAFALTEVLGGWEAKIVSGATKKRFFARAVVVASGGPGGDPNWRNDHIGEGVLLRGARSSNGRIMQFLAERGFRTVGDPSSCHMVAVDARGPEDDGGIVTRITAIPHGLVVDRNGRRVELAGASPKKSHYAQWGARIAACDGGLAFLILDARGLSKTLPAALAPIRADTLDALAAELGLDGAALAESVPFVEPPFFAFPMRAGLTFVHYGLAADANMRLSREGNANLFGAGMIVAPNFFTRGYMAGLGLTLSAVTGRRAGEAAARHVLS
ncbi:FAD-dependent tricarballylate dehydrogenase TcuA [Rhodoblastus acidophilus]|uniref:FAD-dependent tricarballylate dehydrogenase TcuA n=1 Tax=Rhodoblastus acidophilus TaxID=1074 RepID=A0A6N8DRX6_RHOAC|nr:FAD-dependent tricarballylate dehydrogenase TcuA [Rhodoblastus acidophilus]MCW2274630.1 tricarballylate dehydrogenase [Rhodoblastus acidophilus]MTV32576.1 FAD-dependent tricarballylate dehydrogenase TcuA [Rhodoblastus acidophilus]